MKRKFFRGQLFFLPAILILALFLPQDPLRADTSGSDVITVGIYENPPKLFRDANGRASGIFAEILGEIARLEGWSIRYVDGSWEECLDRLTEGRIDLMGDVAFSVERSSIYDFNRIPVIQTWSQLYVSPGMDVKRISDLAGKRVSLLEGSVQKSQFSRLMRGFRHEFIPVPAASFGEAFFQVKNGRADAVISNYFFGEMHFRQYGLDKSPLIFDPVSLHYAVRKGEHAPLIGVIDRYLKNWLDTPGSYYFQILDGYFGEPAAEPGARIYFHLLLVAGGLMLGLSFIVFLLRRRVRAGSETLSEANLQLQNEESKFRSYIENAPFGIFVAGPDGNFLEVNREACRMTGYSEKELLSISIPDLFPDYEKPRAMDHFNRVTVEGKASGTFVFLTREGRERYWAVIAVRISRERLIGFVQDVTESQENLAELRKLKDDLQQDVDHKTRELKAHISELERFRDATIEREFRIRELTDEIDGLKEGRK